MPASRLPFTLVALVFSLSTSGVLRAQQPTKDADFERLHKELCSTRELWQDIPWRLSLLEAQTAAASS